MFGITSRVSYLRSARIGQLSRLLSRGKICFLFIHLGGSDRSRLVATSIEAVQRRVGGAVRIFGIDAEADPRLVEQLLPRTVDLPVVLVCHAPHSPHPVAITRALILHLLIEWPAIRAPFRW